jgi:hypothetical protein
MRLSASTEEALTFSFGRRRRRGAAQRKAYDEAVPGSSAPRGRGGRQVWIAGDFRAGEFRSRREALKHCPAGVSPVPVTVRPDEDRSEAA